MLLLILQLLGYGKMQIKDKIAKFDEYRKIEEAKNSKKDVSTEHLKRDIKGRDDTIDDLKK